MLQIEYLVSGIILIVLVAAGVAKEAQAGQSYHKKEIKRLNKLEEQAEGHKLDKSTLRSLLVCFLLLSL